MVNMILCPNCRTIQREGERCPLCSCPVEKDFQVVGKAVPRRREGARKEQGFPSPYAYHPMFLTAPVPQPG